MANEGGALRLRAGRIAVRLRPLPAAIACLAAALVVASSATGGAAAGHGAVTSRATSHRAPAMIFRDPVMVFPDDDPAPATDPSPPVAVAAPDPADIVAAASAAPAPAVAHSLPRDTPAPTARPVAAAPSRSGGYAPFGTMLIPGCSWAPMIPYCDPRMNVYSNGGNLRGRYDCTQLVRRWLRWAWNEPPVGGPASYFWSVGPSLPVPLAQHPNGGADLPQFGDVMVFAPTANIPTGHTGIVSGLHAAGGQTYVDMIEQNGDPSGTTSFRLSGTTVSTGGRPPLYGWLRPAAPGPLPRPDIPVSLSATWPGGGASWSGRSATFYAPANATVTGHWSGYMCIGVRRDEPNGTIYASGTCYWDGASVAMTEPPSDAMGRYTVSIQPAAEPPFN